MLGRNAPSDVEVLNSAQERLSKLLPPDWTARVDAGKEAWADFVLNVRAPDGSTGKLLVQAKAEIEPKQAKALAARLRIEPGTSVVAAPFLSKRTRDELELLGVGYIDLVGNAFLKLDRPALYVRTSGEEKNPWIGRRTGRTLRGPKAARIVRLLCDSAESMNVSQIAERTKTDTGYVSRILDVLEADALIERASRGPVQKVAWEGLIRRWTYDYNVLKSNSYATFLDPRELSRLPARFERVTLRYAFTGSFAAYSVAQVATPRLLMAYVDEPSRIANDLSLKPTTAAPNVILLRPFDQVVYERSVVRRGVRCVAMSQLAADLLTGPGRMPEEAEAVLAWMRTNEGLWRK